MMKEFNKLEEIEKYYNKETNTYIFHEDGVTIVKFHFSLNIEANIDAPHIEGCDIKANNIEAWNITVSDITALDIDAWDIRANNINARDIKAFDIRAAANINAHDIKAFDIKVGKNINANKISYYAVCFAYNDITCRSIKGRRKNAKHFVLDGKLARRWKINKDKKGE